MYKHFWALRASWPPWTYSSIPDAETARGKPFFLIGLWINTVRYLIFPSPLFDTQTSHVVLFLALRWYEPLLQRTCLHSRTCPLQQALGSPRRKDYPSKWLCLKGCKHACGMLFGEKVLPRDVSDRLVCHWRVRYTQTPGDVEPSRVLPPSIFVMPGFSVRPIAPPPLTRRVVQLMIMSLVYWNCGKPPHFLVSNPVLRKLFQKLLTYIHPRMDKLNLGTF